MKRWILAIALVALSASIYSLVELTSAVPATSSAGTAAVAPGMMAPVAVAPAAMKRRARPGLAEAVEGGKGAPAQVSEERTASGSPPTGEEMRDHIEASFAAEPPVAPSQDRAPGLEKRVLAVIPPGSSVRRLECRSSLCRIETMHSSMADFRDFVQRAYLTPDSTRVSNGPVFAGLLAQPVEGQPVIAVAFLGRDGAVLPTLAPAVPAGGP